jgi:Na+-driven multidrug efflux pump
LEFNLKNNSANIDYIKDDLKKLYGKFLWASIFAMLAEGLTSIVDMIILGHYMGSDLIAAVNICMPVYMLYNTFAMLIGAGGATVYAYYLGQKGQQDAESNSRHKSNSFFTCSVVLAGMVSVIFAAVGLAFTPQIAAILGANQQVYHYVFSYLKPLFCFSPVFMFYASMVFFVKYDGGPNLVFVSTMCCAVVNLTLDVVFVGLLKMGAGGGALATSLGYCSALIILASHFFSKNNTLKLVKLKIKNTLRILSAGLPVSVTQFGMFITTVIFNNVLISHGSEDLVAIYAVITQLSFIGLAIYEGSAGAAAPIIAANNGANETERIKGVLKIGLRTELAATFLCAAVYCISAPLLAKLFSITGSGMIAETAAGIRTYALAVPFTGINVLILYYFQAKEKAVPASSISLLHNSVFMIISLYVLTTLFGKNGVWWCYLMAETLTLIVSLILFTKEKKHNSA